jgi:hypothetical protein
LVGKMVERPVKNFDQELDHHEFHSTSSLNAPEHAPMVPPLCSLEYRRSHHPFVSILMRWFNIKSSWKYRPHTKPHTVRALAITVTSMAVVVGIYALIYFLSKLKAGNSTFAERVWTTGWLITGSLVPFGMQLGNVLGSLFESIDHHPVGKVLRYALLTFTLLLLLAGVFPIGGIVVVIQEMLAFGSCTPLS